MSFVDNHGKKLLLLANRVFELSSNSSDAKLKGPATPLAVRRLFGVQWEPYTAGRIIVHAC
jgi:hypothetical protein